jgi:hypothetical protein
MEGAKTTAPIRPHRLAPDQRPLQTLIALPVAILDRLLTTGRRAVEGGVAELRKRASRA